MPGKSHGQRNLVGYNPWGCRVVHNLATEHAHTSKYLIVSVEREEAWEIEWIRRESKWSTLREAVWIG